MDVKLTHKFMREDREIWIITELPISSRYRSSGDTSGRLEPSQSTEPSTQLRSTIPVEKLKREMEAFLSDIGDIFAHSERQLEQQKTALQVDEIELSIEISAEGQVSLFGIGGKTGGKGAITLKLKRKEVM
jgi:hypothetical protein